MKKDYEVVISGMSGAFPECLSLQEFEEKLYGNENLVKDHLSPYQDTYSKMGKINDPVYFDDVFFGVHKKLATVMDIHTKHSFEKTYEAIIDAGVNPQDLDGSNTAVMMSSFLSETEGANMLVMKHFGYVLLGHGRCMQSNRVSYAFNFKGPSFTMIGSWEGSVDCFALAHNLIRRGHAKAAIIGTTNISFYSQVDNHFRDLGRLNEDGKTKSFSADADGYSRSEGIAVFFLQRAEDARRSYGSVVKVLSRAQMDNREELTYPCSFNHFLGDFYSDIPVKSSELAYIEGDGSATLIRDAMELNALAEVLSPGRTKPLPVTCCKSKIGHSESAAPFLSLISALIGLKTGYIPPVLHYSAPNPLVPALKDGSIKIVTEKMPIEGEYVGVTAMGFCNTFAHMLIKRNPRTRSLKKDEDKLKNELPRIFVFSGRNEETMQALLEKIDQDEIDEGFYTLDYTIYKRDIPRHQFRGYSIKGKEESKFQVIPQLEGGKRQLWYIFTGMGSQWLQMGKGIMEIPVIRESLEKSHKFLMENKQINLLHIITSTDESVFDNILNCFIGIAAIQIALVDMLEALGIEPDGMIGHSVGEQGCGYADKSLTAEQVLLAAYARGRASNEANLIKGMMAAIGKGYRDIKDELPEGIEVACHNSDISCTLSGPAELMEKYVADLKSRGIFARLVNVANTAYHSQYIAPAGPIFVKYLKEVIPEPKKRSRNWLSSSVPESQWDTDLAKYSSAEYYSNNLLSPVLFEESATKIPDNAVCIEIAPHGLLQAIVKRSLTKCVHIPLTNRGKEGCYFTMEALALMYSNGIQADFSKLYPPVVYPVPRETRYMNNLMTWTHTFRWPLLSEEKNREVFMRKAASVYFGMFRNPDELMVLSANHRVAGVVVLPLANLLCATMEALTNKMEDEFSFKTYNFKNLKFVADLNIQIFHDDKIQVLYQKGAGAFEVVLPTLTPLMHGILRPMFFHPEAILNHQHFNNSFTLISEISKDDIYNFFQEKDCTFKEDFQNILDVKIYNKGFIGRVEWNCNAQYYIDAILKLIIFYSSLENDTLMEIESIGEFLYSYDLLPQEETDITVFYDSNMNELAADGIKINFVKTRPNMLTNSYASPEVVKHAFVAYQDCKSQNDFIEECFQAVVESAVGDDISVIGNKKSPIFQLLISSEYFNNTVKSKVNIRVDDFKDVNINSFKGSESIVIISDGKLLYPFVNLIETTKQDCYLIQSATNDNELTSFKNISPILDQSSGNRKIIFYKKLIKPLVEASYIQVSEGCLLNDKDQDKIIDSKSTFIVYKYRNLADIPNIIASSNSVYSKKCSRFVFIDKSSPHFDITSDFFLQQLTKDLKMNVCHEGAWGHLRARSMTVPFKPKHEFKQCQLPLKNIRCDDINLNVLALNLQGFITPSDDVGLGVLEYVGTKKHTKETIIGLGKLSPDHNIIPDPILVWKKPEHWTLQQAATVPLFYSMAYYLLHFKCIKLHVVINKILIHGGHTAFAQAFIQICSELKSTVYTTCFTAKQKEAILKRFPQIDKSKIFVLNEESKCSCYDGIMMTTDGKGVDVVIDCLNDLTLRDYTIKCLGRKGKYYLICHNNMESDFTFGMRVFNNEVCVSGFNPDLLFNMSQEEKNVIVKMVGEGIKRGSVKPLISSFIDGSITSNAAVKSLLESTHDDKEEVKKVLVNIEQTAHRNGDLSAKAVSDKNAYLIIGNYNVLWFDIMEWLTSLGAKRIYILLNDSNIPEHIQIRLNAFLNKHSASKIHLLDYQSLSTANSFEKTLQKLVDIKLFDKAFYIMPGMESKLEMVDSTLRKLCPKCWLICIEKGSNNVTEKRNKQGFKGISFILKKDSVRNQAVLNVFDHWIRQPQLDNDQIIFLDEAAQTEVLGHINDPNILPITVDDLIELSRSSVKVPQLREISTSGLTDKASKELNPAFIFPGLKMLKSRYLISQLNYPAYLAWYPTSIKSINEIAAQFTKIIINNFNLVMFTLIAEGWAGPLVLTIAKNLEIVGKSAEVILLDAAPQMVKRWPKQVKKSVISSCMPALNKNEELTIDNLKKEKSRINNLITSKDNVEFSEEEVTRSMDILINRLEAVTSHKDENQNIFLSGNVHLFTTRDDLLENHQYIVEINEISNVPCLCHVIEASSSENLLENKQLIDDISNLILQERKGGCTMQTVAQLGQLEIKDLRYNFVCW